MNKEVSILDFGSHKITVLTGQRGANGALLISGMGECEYAGFCDGEWLKPEQLSFAVAKAISGAENNSGQKIRHLFIGVPGEFSMCVCKEVSINLSRRHKINENDVEDLLSAGSREVEGRDAVLINRQPIYYYLDDNRRLIDPVGLTSTKLGGLISYVTAESRFVSCVDAIMVGVGIESSEYVSSVLAESLFLFDDARRDKGAILLDVGYMTSTLAVIRGDGLLSMNSFSMGGAHITANLCEYFGITSSVEAEALKRKIVLTLATEDDDVYEINGREYNATYVNALAERIIQIIGKTAYNCVEMCPYTVSEMTPVSITGGGISYIRGAKEIVSETMSRDVEIVAPAMPQLSKPHMASSLGLLNLTLDAEAPVQKKKGFFAKLFK